jgi:choice-of-anchor C domain-containing protein
MSRSIAVIMALLALTQSALAQGIVNGGFEQATVDPGSFNTMDAGDTRITGWTVIGNNINYIGTYWTSSQGGRSLDLIGANTVGGVEQTFATTPGATYQVLFDLAGNPDGGPAIKPLTVSAAGTSQTYTFNTSGRSRSAMGWTTQTFIFTATSPATTLRFLSDGTASGNTLFGAALDNVRVSETSPSAPGTPSATAGNAWATVTWSAPASNGGSAITNYTVTASPGGRQCVTNSGAVTSCTVTGLANGTAHSFTVTARNAVGNGPSSPASSSITPQGVTGLIDIVGGAALGYSVRQLRAAYSGPTLRVRRSADNAAADLYFDTSGNLTTGNVVSVTAVGSSALAVDQSLTLTQFANGGDVLVTTWFDQSTNGRHALEVAGRTPALMTGGSLQAINSRAAVRFTTSALALEGVPTTGSSPWTFSGVATHEAGVTELFGWGDNSGTSRRAGVWVDVSMRNTLEVLNAGRFGSTIATGQPTLRTWRYSGGTLDAGLSAWLNGNADTLSSDGTTLNIQASGQTVIGDVPRAIGAHPHRGQVGELVLFGSALPIGTNLAVQQDQASYFGVPLPPGFAWTGSFNAFDTTVAAGSVSGSIQTRVAGTAFSLAIVALNSARTALNTGYTGTVTVQLMDARDSSGALDANGCRATWTTISGASTSVTFSSGSNGRVNATLSVDDALQDVRARMTQGTNAGCSNDNFAIRPASIVVSAIDADWQSAFTGAGSPRSLGNAGATGGVVHAAGRPFTLSAIGYNSAGAVTPGYDGLPTVRSGYPVCALPSGCTTGALSFSAWSTGGSGQRLATDASYSEVGTFTLELEDTSFAAVDAADTVPALRTVPQSGGAITVGRFVPAYFELVPSGAAPTLRTMNTTDAACSVAPVGTPRRSFTYVGQPFGFAVLPQATILARNASGATTANYRGNLWKLGPGEIARSIDATNTTPTGQASSVSLGTLAAGDVVSSNNGTGTVTGSALDAITYTRSTTTPVAPFTASIRAQILVNDATEAGPTGNPATIGTTGIACFNGGGTCAAPGAGIAFDSEVPGFPGNEFRYGRLRLANANGSELIALPLPMLAEHWNASAWVPNTRDFCTTVPVNRVALSNWQRNLNAGETTPTIAGPLLAGSRSIIFSAPGAGNAGSVDLTIDLSASGANLPWLQGAWTGATFTQNPAARATFGTHALPSPVIFRRERF